MALVPITQFVASSVHSYATHNVPHNELESNIESVDSDLTTLSGTVSSLSSTVSTLAAKGILVRITPVVIYKVSYSAHLLFTGKPILSYKEFSAAENWALLNSYAIHSYPAAIPAGVSTILLNCGIISVSGSEGFMNLRGSSFSEDTVCESISSANSDDNASDNVTIEMPYESSRQFQSYCGGSGHLWFSIAAVGYRT